MTRGSLTVKSGEVAIKTRVTADKRREMIIEAAARVFGRRGFEATRMGDVAAEAEVAKGLLYKHFPSKDALFEALLAQQAEVFAMDIRKALTDGTASDPMDLLRQGFSVWVEYSLSEGPEFNFADPGIHDAYDLLRERVKDEIAAVLEAIEPSADKELVRLVAAGVQGAAESMVLDWAKRTRTMPAGDLVELLAAFCWEGMQGLQASIGDARFIGPTS